MEYLSAKTWQVLDPEVIPYDALTKACAYTTVPIRLFCFIFLRWIPGPPLPRIAGTLFAINLPAFITLCLSKPHYDTKSNTSEIIISPDPSSPSSDTLPDNNNNAESDPINNGEAKEPAKLVVDATNVKVMSRSKISPWKTLLLGVPEMDNPFLTLTTLLLNVCLIYWTFDLTWTSTLFYKSHDLSFARVGWVSETSARILIREPKESDFVVNNPVYVVSYRLHEENEGSVLREFPIPKWATIQVQPFRQERDFTSAVEIKNLRPNKKYRYLTTGNHSGTFTTAPRYQSGGKFSFLTSSCLKHRVPYNPLQRHPLSLPGFKTLGRLLPKLQASFMLFLGDFIYIDVPRRPGTDKESYRMMYRQVYASPDWPSVGSTLPWIHVIDDHEIANDWSSGETGLWQSAMDPYYSYLHSVNPPPVRSNATYYTFNWGSASFFMLDTRRYRSPAQMEDGPSKTMLGAEQRAELQSWLHRVDRNIRWKIIVSSVPFTKNWQHNSDTWRAYLWERAKILEDMWAVKGAGVVILSGDRHEFAATKFAPPPGSPHPEEAAVHEFSVSPLSQFYLPIRTYKQTDTEDKLIKYLPDGNQKFGHVEIDSTNPAQSMLKYRLYIDGVEKWSWVLLS